MSFDPDLRAKFVVLHGERRVVRAELGALFLSALAVYQLAGERRAAAEDAIAAALEALDGHREVESEWLAIVHGLALQRARMLDTDPPTPARAENLKKLHDLLASWEWSDAPPANRGKLRRGLRRRRLERRGALRLIRKGIPQRSRSRDE